MKNYFNLSNEQIKVLSTEERSEITKLIRNGKINLSKGVDKKLNVLFCFIDSAQENQKQKLIELVCENVLVGDNEYYFPDFSKKYNKEVDLFINKQLVAFDDLDDDY